MATQAKTVQVPLEARAVSGALKVLTEQVPLEARASTEPEATNFYNALLDIIGAGSILEGWRIDETSGDAIGVKGIANMTPGADVIAQGLSTGVDERPVAAQIQVASPGQAFDAGDVNLLDFDFPNDTFSVIVWAKLNGTVASGF
ncbi:MAG: hypothetical protein GTO63_28170, partial [Anaerolineae bacterium]|nr:hypothetical protein [Anaerolineae bacterium]